MRRLMLVTALWLGLLWAAEPLLACQMDSHASDCCPTSTQAPCNHDSGPAGLSDASQLCCASTPIVEPLAISIQKSDTKVPHGASGAADPPPIAVTEIGVSPGSAAFNCRPRFSDLASSFGASTYLRTGRLRL